VQLSWLCVVVIIAACASAKTQEAAPAPLPTVAPPESIEGTYEVDPFVQSQSMRVTLRIEANGVMKMSTQTPFENVPRETHGRWRREGDDLVFTIEGEDTTCKRTADQLSCTNAKKETTVLRKK